MTRTDLQKLLELPPAGFLTVPGWQRQILDERLADLNKHPDDEQAWEEVKAELWPES